MFRRPRRGGERPLDGVIGRQSQQVDIEGGPAGLWVAVESAADVVGVGLAVAWAGVGQAAVPLEVAHIEHLHLQVDHIAT